MYYSSCIIIHSFEEVIKFKYKRHKNYSQSDHLLFVYWYIIPFSVSGSFFNKVTSLSSE